MDKLEWYQSVEKYINDNLQEFYSEFYDRELIPIGANYRVNPCPSCGHNNCCTIAGNTVNCFSGECEWKGTHITAWYAYMDKKKGKGISEAIKKLEEFTGFKFPHCSQEEMAIYEAHHKKQAMLSIAQDFYHEQLLECRKSYSYNHKTYTPLDYMLYVRNRKMDTLKHFKVGFSTNYFELYNKLLAEGYTKEEIKDAKVWAPDGVFIFFYRNPLTKDIVRTNIKNPFEARYKNKDEEGNEVLGDVIVGYSTGGKSMFFSPEFNFNDDVVLVEGEHDVMAAYENGYSNIAGTGGQIERDSQLGILNRLKDGNTIYTMYDNDSAGEKYTQFTNEFFADKPVKQIKYDESFKDPDEYFKCTPDTKTMLGLMDEAKPLHTDKYAIRRRGQTWIIATREKRLEFTLKSKADNGSLKGSAVYYINGVINDRDEDILLVKCKAKIKPLNFNLYDHLEEYFNSGIESKDISELLSVYSFSSKKQQIMKELARRVYESHDRDSMVGEIKIKVREHVFSKADDLIDEILKEVNDIQNRESKISPSNIPKIRIGQYFNTRNDDAYMYFTYVKADGDAMRNLPFLLRNDGTLIRLDLLKRKDSQCLLLIDNKYQLPDEVPTELMRLQECSLTQEWVERFIEGEIPDDELDPGYLVTQIEDYIRRFYYTDDPSVYKIVALYIYTTYYYELFAQIPYLFLNGSKGSGKSILNEVINLFAFNSKMAIDTSESAIFRLIDREGGTLILDEQENLSVSSGRTLNNSLAAILKGGYSRSGSVIRSDVETGGTIKYDAYGPKVISCINGIDDVIEDRCILITSYPLRLTKETKMEDPKPYKSERLDEIREVTSKCALSALVHFQELARIYRDSLFETDGNARLSQILTPLLATAKLADRKENAEALRMSPGVTEHIGKFERGIINYWNYTLKPLKSNTEKDTPEGIIKRSVAAIARELYGLVPPADIEYTDTTLHKYNEAIKSDKEEGWFEVNVFHLKCFIEEIRTGEVVQPRSVSRWTKTVFKFAEDDIKRRTILIENEELLKEMKGSARPKVNCFRFYFKDFINMDKEFMEDKKVVNTQDDQLF